MYVRPRPWMLAAFILLLPGTIRAEVTGLNDGPNPSPSVALLRLNLPIRGSVDTEIRVKLDQIIGNLAIDAARPIVVIELWPPTDGDGDRSEFGRSLDLARYLSGPRMSGVRTVAYLPKTVRGHAVLVALACEEIIMAPEAEIGAAGIFESHVDPTVRRGYSEIADRRRTIPSAVALGMLDPALHVQRVTTAVGSRYVLSEEVEELQQTTAVQAIDTVIPEGDVGLLSGDKLRLEYHFVSHLARDRRELAAALDVSPMALEIDPSLGGNWIAIRIELRGAITSGLVNRIIRGVEDRIRSGPVNLICVEIDSPGGSLQESLQMCSFLADFDAAQLRTVAYVPSEARGDAAIIALCCDQLVAGKDAILGGPGAVTWDDAEKEIANVSLRAILSEKGRNWSIACAFIDPDLEVSRYDLADSTLVGYFSEQERAQQADSDRWQQGETITVPGESLQLDGMRAMEWGVARDTVGDFGEFLNLFNLSEAPETLEQNWANELIAALATPQVSAALLFIGGFALIAELSAPGVGIGGFVSAVCFLLFFWSNFLMGTAGWLEGLLFVAGIFFVALEILVLPGFGIFGLGGATMMLLALVLASQTFIIPRNAYQMEQLPRSMFAVVAAIGGIITSGIMLRRYLETLPFLKRVVLAPPEGDLRLELERRESVVDYAHLVDQTGIATTPLSPSGKADFDGELVDVVSEGLAVARGAPLRVVKVAGNRVVVTEATPFRSR